MTSTPVVFIHPFPFDARIWRSQLDAVGSARTVLAPDLRGFGRNRACSYPGSIEQHARDLIELLDRSGLPRAALVGLSMGGYVALALARMAPERIAALMLCDTRADADTPEGREARTARMARVHKQGISFLPDEMLPSLVGPACPEPLKLELRAMILEQDPRGVEAALGALRDRPDSTAVLESVRVPCAVVCGQHDALTPPAVMKPMAARIPGASWHEVGGAGHLSCREAPEAFNSVLTRWLEAVP